MRTPLQEYKSDDVRKTLNYMSQQMYTLAIIFPEEAVRIDDFSRQQCMIGKLFLHAGSKVSVV